MAEQEVGPAEPSLARKAVSGAIWTTATGLAARGLSLAATVIVTNYIVPAEYAEVCNASVLVLTANQFATLGVGAYIIAYPKSGRVIAFHATFIHAVLGVLALGLVYLFRDRFGPMFSVPHLARF